jgi:UDP-N-acetylmuramyl pentapeptide phosphotransferase/UDP-N-acetylglucosamine-1-phosphate transferase
MVAFIIIVLVLIGLELGYIQLADRFNIIDKPNERSSHTRPTIRGGGVLFAFAWIIYFMLDGWHFPYFTVGMLCLAGISFWDDVKPLSNRVRILVHILAFSLCFYEIGIFSFLPWWGIVMAYIVAIGCLNAVNFMDGINGITGLYALSIFGPILWVYPGQWERNPLSILITSIVVFGWFNFRKRARCFAGDVGSVSIAYLIIFFVMGLMLNMWQIDEGNLVIKSGVYRGFEPKYILLLTLYGVDVILTLIHRLYLKENIFQAHRKHLFQYLANEMKWPHLAVSLLYAGIQSIISCWVLTSEVSLAQGVACILFFSIIYIVTKRYIYVEKIKNS